MNHNLLRSIVLTVMSLTTLMVQAAHYEVSSPNGKLTVTVNTDEAVTWSVSYNGTVVLLPSTIDIQMQQGGKILGMGKIGKVDDRIPHLWRQPAVPLCIQRVSGRRGLEYEHQRRTVCDDACRHRGAQPGVAVLCADVCGDSRARRMAAILA